MEIYTMPLTGKEELPVSKLKALVNHLPGAVYRCRGDEHLTLEFFSDEIVNLTGYPIRYFLDDKTSGYAKLIHPEDVEKCRIKTREAISRKEKYEIEYRIVHQNGSVRWVLETGQGVYDTSDQVSYVDGCIFDITQRKETEAALAKTRDEVKTLALVAHNTTNSVMIANASEEIIWVNKGYTQISGYTEEELKGKKIGYSLDGPGCDPEVAARISDSLAKKQPYKETFISHKKNGDQIWLEVDCQPLLDEEGKHLGFMSIENDITDRMKTLQAMEELLQRLTLATNSAEIGIFEIDLSTNEVIWDD
ncbi:MAG: PAS domain-containing protein, partial [Bacteroidota bacterium]|nr:PAS domain-containing protein [Bacteroidota bacterium]